MKRLLGYLEKYWGRALLAPLFKCLEACFELFVPLLISGMIDRGIGNGDYAYILRMGLLLVLLALIGLACSVTAQYFAAAVATETARELRNDLFSHIGTLEYPEIDRLGTATLITRMSSDINLIENGINMVLRLFMRSPFIVFGSIFMAFRISSRAALVFCIVVPLLALVVFGIMKLSMPLYRGVQKQLDTVLKLTRENLSGLRVVRAFHRQEGEISDFRENTALLSRLQITVGKISALLNPLTCIVLNFGLIVLVLSGAGLVDSAVLSRGSVVALVSYMGQILVELVKLANLIILISRAYAGLGRVSALFETGESFSALPETADRSIRTEDAPLLSLEGLSFRYGEGGEPALEGLSLSVKRGETIGIIGGTGAGKTTLVNLLLRFYEPDEGRICYQGQDIRSAKPESHRRRFGLVPQRSVLFSGTLRENMQWGKEDASEEEIRKALRTAQALDFVMEKGLDFVVEQEGRNLSGGQRQRLCIARALVRDPEVLILDDAASALDFATDAALRKAIRSESGDRTVILVSQRISTVRGADRILVLEDGRTAGLGTHKELYESCTVYREICLSQLSREEAERNAG